MRTGRGVGPTLLVAVLVAVGLVLGPLDASPVQAADDGLDLVTKATYTLAPKDAVVHVAVVVTATNTKPNLVEQTTNGTRTTRYFYERASLVLPRESTRVRASAGGSRLTVTQRPQPDYTVTDVAFRSDLFYHQSLAFRVDFDLPAGAPRSRSDIRIGAAFATFYVWAFGDAGDVRVVVPAGFTVTTSGSALETSGAGTAATTLSATGVTDISQWYAIIVAERPAALTSERIDLAGGEHLVIRAWPEDAEWRTQVGDVLRKGLPALVELVGLDWPVVGDIEVDEVHTPLLEGYGGIFHVDENQIEISEDLDELTIVHEASHAWFNSGLFVGRWINEGFADDYAARVLDQVSTGGQTFDPVSPDSEGHVALNDWTFPGRIADATTDARETFGYDASWRVLDALVTDVGEDGMRKVIRAADAGQIAYVGGGTPETGAAPADWQRFLDLLEELGGSTKAGDLFRSWVVTPAQAKLLDDRDSAREAYKALVGSGAGWLPGIAIRQPMADWDFETATTRISAAAAILATRDRIASLASTAGVAPPANLESAYEAATDLSTVAALADEQLAAVEAVADAKTIVTADRDPVTSLGLLGEDPDGEVAAAVAAIGAGDTARASAAAARAAMLIAAAPESGRVRLLGGGGLIIGGGLLAGGSAMLLRRRRRPETEAFAAMEPPDSYVTLGAPPAEAAGQEPATPRDEEPQ